MHSTNFSEYCGIVIKEHSQTYIIFFWRKLVKHSQKQKTLSFNIFTNNIISMFDAFKLWFPENFINKFNCRLDIYLPMSDTVMPNFFTQFLLHFCKHFIFSVQMLLSISSFHMLHANMPRLHLNK